MPLAVRLWFVWAFALLAITGLLLGRIVEFIDFSERAPFSLLGIDQWVGGFEYVSYFDSFDGYHPRVFTPQDTGPREFRSMEEVGNFLLANPEAVAHFRSRGKTGKVMLVMFDEQTEDLVRGLGFEMALPSAKLRTHIDSKITTTRLGNEAGLPTLADIKAVEREFGGVTLDAVPP